MLSQMHQAMTRSSLHIMTRFARARSTMAYQYTKAGIPSNVISATQVPAPTSPPASGKVFVKWRAVGIDVVDLAALSGLESAASFSPAALPAVPGSEGFGVVTAVGDGISSLQEGDHVIPVKTNVGTWREWGQVNANDVMRVPSEIRPELAATLPGSPCTAYRLLNDYQRLQSGDVILQTAGGSSVGSALSQMASQRGLRLISLVSESARDYAATVERLKLQGSEVVIGESYVKTEGFKSVVQDMDKVKLAFHGSGDVGSCEALTEVLPHGCEVIWYCPGVADSRILGKRGVAAKEFSLAHWLRSADRAQIEDMLKEVCEQMIDGRLTGWLQRVRFDELPHAIKRGGMTRRKLVAMMEGFQ